MSMVESVSAEDLAAAVRASRSWRGVLRALGLPESSSRLGRLVRARCDELRLDYSHFDRQRSWTDADLVRLVPEAASWSALLGSLGYETTSRSARARVRSNCARLGVRTRHLDAPHPQKDGLVQVLASARPENLRKAGPLLVAALLTLKHCQVSWPLEPAAYDLLVDSGEPPTLRVQVKTTTYRSGGTWVCSISRSSYTAARRWAQPEVYGIEEIDYFGIVDGDIDVYFIPSALVAGRRVISLNRYRAFVIGRAPSAFEDPTSAGRVPIHGESVV